MIKHLSVLPAGLPVPIDDGLADHLEGKRLPSLTLISTSGASVNLASIQDKLVIYVYPLTGRSEIALPEGWDEIPGARGCTPQACDFGNHYLELLQLNANVFGLSSQATDYQLELKQRLHLPFDLLSDNSFQLRKVLTLPVFRVGELLLYKRLTLIAENNVIKKVFYPVFPPNENASQVVDWLKNHQLTRPCF
ncbi:MAG: peroxiredoxin [Methylotenera sp.]|nr:peroxiredoxin [Methylotenera sp.]